MNVDCNFTVADSWSGSEMAERTEMSVGNVGWRLHHVLKHLADALRRSGVEGARG